MRLIDADALIEQIKNPYTEYPVMIKIRKAIEDMINETPTVFQCVENVGEDESALKHGHWNEEMGGYVCCLCEGFSDFATNYCPHCGAKMDEEAK